MALAAERRRKSKPVAIGLQASELLDREPKGLVALRPLEDGVVVDLETAKTFLAATLRGAGLRRWGWPGRRAVLAIPSGATSLERRALLEIAGKAGLGSAALIAAPVAAAVACEIDPMDSRAHMVLDVGAGTAEVTTFCYGGFVAHRSSRVAGDEMTFAVQGYLRERHHLTVSIVIAQQIKALASTEEGPSFVVRGVDAASGRPRLVTLAVEEVDQAVQPVLDAILQILMGCLRDLPPRVVIDVMDEGILAVGGGCQMRGLDKVFEAAFGFPFRLADRPLTSVAEGAALCASLPAVLAAYGGG